MRTAPHLAFTSAGDGSAIASWCRSGHGFDAAVVYHGDGAFEPPPGVAYFFRRRGFKFANFLECARRHPAVLDSDYTLFIDDDIVMTPAAVEQLFALARQHAIDACQPALAPGSVGHWKHTHQDASKQLEFTNLVEIQCFCVSRKLLALILPLLPLIVTGWGLDLVFWDLLGRPRDKMAILHGVPMFHPRRQEKRVSDLVPDFDRVAGEVEENLSEAMGWGRRRLFGAFRVESFGGF
jgi:hypothetical protein